MAFLDDISKKISTAADLAADKAKELADTGKLKLDIAAEEKEMQKLYAEIGKSVYVLEKDDPESRYAAECYKITEHQMKIDALKAEAEKAE